MNSLLEFPSEQVPVIRHAGEGARLPVFGGDLTWFVTAADSGGRLLAGLLTAPPDNGPPIHLHRDEDEILIVLEGNFSFYTNEVWTDVGPGASVFLPRGLPHAFRNIGSTPGKLYVIVNSPGLQTFFDRCEAPFYQPDGPDMRSITAIGGDHGIRFVPPLL